MRQRGQGSRAGEEHWQRQAGVEVRVDSRSRECCCLCCRGKKDRLCHSASVCPLGTGEPSQEREKGGPGGRREGATLTNEACPPYSK